MVVDLIGEGLDGLFGGNVVSGFGDLFGEGLEDLNGVLFGESLSIQDG